MFLKFGDKRTGNLFQNIILSCLHLLKILYRGKIYPDFIFRDMYYTCNIWDWTSLPCHLSYRHSHIK